MGVFMEGPGWQRVSVFAGAVTEKRLVLPVRDAPFSRVVLRWIHGAWTTQVLYTLVCCCESPLPLIYATKRTGWPPSAGGRSVQGPGTDIPPASLTPNSPLPADTAEYEPKGEMHKTLL
ncbi:P protein [Platysternon megacephalum]|uniref:P protein n=1 Tax=Platysternon megacephalum TaxID=55544 RepID=A0A4D9EFP1_9SAUR|nr:P protein [Platysternon megacephalum]